MATELNVKDRQTAEEFIAATRKLGISWHEESDGRTRTADFLNRTGNYCCPMEGRYAKEMGGVGLLAPLLHYRLGAIAYDAVLRAADNKRGCDSHIRQRVLELVNSEAPTN